MAKTKFLRVAKSGKTVDGREITPAQIRQMGSNYDPKLKYGARVNIEHYVSMMPDGIFRCVGDVLTTKYVTDPDGAMVLLAQFDATDEAVRLAATRQKVYFSIEVIPNFAGSGEAYLGGLALTDSPASLGTEMLTFAIKSDKAPGRLKDNLFSVPLESTLEPDEEQKDAGPSLLSKVKDMLSGKVRGDDARFDQVEASVTAIAEAVSEARAATAGFATADAVTALTAKVDTLSTTLADLTARLSTTTSTPPRPLASGTDANQTDC